jgi:hypothetical protein
VAESGGVFGPNAGSRIRFEFDVKFKTADGSDGYAVVRFESGGRSYRIRSDDVDSIGALGPLVDFRATRWTGSAHSKQALNGGRLDVR